MSSTELTRESAKGINNRVKEEKPKSGKKGADHAWNYIGCAFVFGTRGRAAEMVAQQRVRLFPDRRSGSHSCHSRRPLTPRSYLNDVRPVMRL